jgi:Leucine-rich repeat (LRR) protein
MKKIEALFETLSDHQLIIDGLKTIEVEAINKYWLSGKLQQPKGEDEGKSDIKRLLLIAFSPENTLPALQRNSPRMRTAPGYISDFKYYRNEQNFEPAGTLTVTKEFEVLPSSFYAAIFEALQTKKVRIASDAYASLFTTGKINWLKGIKELELRGEYKIFNIPEDIGDLQDLEAFTINFTEMSSIPDSFFNLKKLKYLNLRGNKFTSISEKISNLSLLENIDLSLNKLDFVPDSLSILKNLKELKVFDNPFKDITDFIALDTYRYNYVFDNQTKQNIELKYSKDVLVINKSWIEVPLTRIEEIISTHKIKTLRVESVSMLNRILEPDAVKHFSQITCLDLQWNTWRNRQYERGFFKEMEVVINLQSNDESKIKEIPEGIGLMTWLEELNLKGNKIEKLPESFFDLKKLKKLNLYGNKISELPNLFSSFNELTELNLGNIEFSVIPESIFSLKNLLYLELSSNRTVSVLSPLIANLTQLEELYLESNTLTEIPKELGDLKKLKKLALNRNELTSFPDAILNLSELEEIHIGSQKITDLPKNLSGLHKLKYLDFEEAELQLIPDSIGELKNLVSLNLKQNKITSISDSIKNCSQLTTINLQQNQLLEKLPDEIGNLTNLESLNLHYCSTLKSLPKSLSKLSKLKILDLSYTLIQELPLEIFELKSLVELKLFQLPISTLSPEIKNLENLEYLDLRLTKITELPTEIGELKKLIKLDGCNLNKPLPDSFCNLIKLKELYVNFENVEKSLPENFGNLESLENFDPGSNLSYLPTSFGKLNNLKSLTLRNTKFTEFPLVLTELQSLGNLDLWDNNFSDVPIELTKLKSLYLLRFDNNPLSSSNSIQRKCKALLPSVEFSF